MQIRAAVLAAAVLSGAVTLAPGPVAGAASAPALAARPCSGGQVLAWIGLSGRPGTARGVAVPLEFSNVGRQACSLSGYPGVLPVGPGAHQVAPRARRQAGSRARRVTLRPGQTAHAVLTIGIAKLSCRSPVIAAAVRITPPNARTAQQIGLVFRACAGHPTLTVGPVRAGTGIP